MLNQNKEELLINDIKSHLQYLLNTKQLSMSHLPNYGMPDLNCLLQSLPYSKQDLLREMKTTIERYEPRISNVHIEDKNTLKENALLVVNITAQLRGEKTILFTSSFNSKAQALVNTV